MRIAEVECEYRDMEWYGVDTCGNIAVFCSAGRANLPEFVCESIERAEFLMEYFEKLNSTSACKFCFPFRTPARKVAEAFAGRGLFYFDSDDRSNEAYSTLQAYYTKWSYPLKPLKYDSLPEQMKDLLRFHFMEVPDFSAAETVHVVHAY